MRKLAFLAIFLASPALAEEELPPLLCGGLEPFWDLRITGDRAIFSEPQRLDPLEYNIPHRSRAEGRIFPRALSLIGIRDTAVALVEKRQCNDTMSDREYPFALHLLTQRQGEAILLSGCCSIAPQN